MAIVGGEGFGWDRGQLGNHRAVVEVADADAPARVRLPWRRRDRQPEQVAIVVTAADGTEMARVAPLHLDRQVGDIAFEPSAGPGRYYVYFQPYNTAGSYYPTTTYRAADAATDRPAGREPVEATFVGFEAVAPHHAYTALEAVASDDEVAGLLAAWPDRGFIAFFEDRDQPIRMTRDVPAAWCAGRAFAPLTLVAAPGEFRVFQIGVYAARRPIQRLSLTANGLPWSAPEDAFRCFNLAGINYDGQPMAPTVGLPQGRVQALWCGFGVPVEASGAHQLVLTLDADGEAVELEVTLAIEGEAVARRGDDEPERLSRLRWLDSDLARDDTLVPPFTPITVAGDQLGVLGRDLQLGDDGLPAAIRSWFAPEVTHLDDAPTELLAAPLRFTVARGGQPIAWQGAPSAVVDANDGAVTWQRHAAADGLRLSLRGRLEFDGTIDYEAELTADQRIELDDVALTVPLRAAAATHMVGLGRKGGLRPAAFDWKWSVERNQDAVWLGCAWAGVQVSLRDETYRRPLNTNFYHSKPLRLPRSWHNDGHGGIALAEQDGSVVLTCAGGPRIMEAGEVLRFDWRLALTPFKPLDTAAAFRTRLCHRYLPVSEVAEAGANALVLHHAQAPNPYINYPFLRTEALRRYVDEAHAAGIRLKLYYTVRELTTRAPELWALRSLGDEVFAPGPGGGYSWLCEHVGEDYLAAWFDPTWEDSSLVTNGMSRWHNFYVEGLAWLAEQVGIDGLYIDDLAFDRDIMKRVRRVLAKHRPAPHIDLHSANQFNERDGFASSMNLYLEHLPYLDRLWLGEYFDYDSAPDYWLIDISGIPFGVMGEMLQDGGNPWRGMLFGITCRYPYNGDPRPLWRFWDEVGLPDMAMVGFWSPRCPVATGRDDVLATVYRGAERSVVAVASWAAESVTVTLPMAVTAPAIDGFQPAASWAAGEPITVEPGRGWLLVCTTPLN